MNSRALSIFGFMIFLGVSCASSAEVRYSVSFGNDWHDGRRDWRPYHPYHPYAPYRRHFYYRPVYYYQPVVVEPPPVYVAPPAPMVQPLPSPLSGNYGADLGGLHQKMARLRGVLQNQSRTGQITPDEYARFTNAIEGV